MIGKWMNHSNYLQAAVSHMLQNPHQHDQPHNHSTGETTEYFLSMSIYFFRQQRSYFYICHRQTAGQKMVPWQLVHFCRKIVGEQYRTTINNSPSTSWKKKKNDWSKRYSQTKAMENFLFLNSSNFLRVDENVCLFQCFFLIFHKTFDKLTSCWKVVT